ncbi:hypothetical protein K469DRAFT_788005, partial [Zopfia rhizophila CBS 207.26]
MLSLPRRRHSRSFSTSVLRYPVCLHLISSSLKPTLSTLHQQWISKLVLRRGICSRRRLGTDIWIFRTSSSAVWLRSYLKFVRCHATRVRKCGNAWMPVGGIWRLHSRLFDG